MISMRLCREHKKTSCLCSNAIRACIDRALASPGMPVTVWMDQSREGLELAVLAVPGLEGTRIGLRILIDATEGNVEDLSGVPLDKVRETVRGLTGSVELDILQLLVLKKSLSRWPKQGELSRHLGIEIEAAKALLQRARRLQKKGSLEPLDYFD